MGLHIFRSIFEKVHLEQMTCIRSRRWVCTFFRSIVEKMHKYVWEDANEHLICCTFGHERNLKANEIKYWLALDGSGRALGVSWAPPRP